MKILFDWLKEFVPATASAAGVGQRLSLVGVGVDVVSDSPAGPLFEVDVTANRGDCLGHYGVAREVAAIYRLPLKSIAPKPKESAEKVESVARVEISCPELCARFTAHVVRGVKVGPSPDWLRRRLEALGQTSINNVVDATNYVMFETGKPLHAFDYDTLADHRIIVRRAQKGERLRTLDGIERTLTPEMCVVADARRAVGIGGVMGGAETQITSASKNVLIESAWFDPISLRRTARALALRTEASARFERGADLLITALAGLRTAELIQQLAGGEVLTGVVDAFPRPAAAPKIELTRKEILRVMGADIPDAEIEAILTALGFQPSRAETLRGTPNSLMATWDCTCPSWRHDVTREIDLIEEIARHYGFDKFPSRLPPARQPAARLEFAAEEDLLRERLIALGYQEIITIPLTDPLHDEAFRSEAVTPMRISNPLAEDASLLRTTGVATMVEALAWNVNRGQRNLRLFEIGKTYQMQNGAPVETRILTLGSTGLAREKSIHDSAREFSFADLKGELERLGELAGNFTWNLGGPAWLAGNSAATVSFSSSNALGAAGQLSRPLADALKLRQDVFLAELLLDPLLAAIRDQHARLHYEPLPRFPAVERDFSLTLADGITFSQVADEIRALNIPELSRIEAVDLFRGGQVPAGKFSLLVRVTLQSRESTFTESQLSDFTSRIVRALESRLGASLRTV